MLRTAFLYFIAFFCNLGEMLKYGSAICGSILLSIAALVLLVVHCVVFGVFLKVLL